MRFGSETYFEAPTEHIEAARELHDRKYYPLSFGSSGMEEELMGKVQEVLERINPRLAKIEALEADLSHAMDAIHHVNGRVDAIIDMRHPPSLDE